MKSVTLKDIRESFGAFYGVCGEEWFIKTAKLKYWSERELLLLVRLYLYGYFGIAVTPEYQTKDPLLPTKLGRLDFVIGKVAVEFAVRKKGSAPGNIKSPINQSEMRKLLLWNDGPAVLVLFDFSDEPISIQDLQKYRDLPSLGKGNHSKSAVNILYFYRHDNTVKHHQLNLKVNSKHA